MYKVVAPFADIEDELRIYEEGETYPRKGLKATKERIKSLSTSDNAIGRPLIKEVKDK